MPDSVHEGHRARMKEQFVRNNIEFFDAHQVLEMLLFFSIPRRDTNPLAHRLIERFGGLTDVLEADYQQLCRVEGVSEQTAVLLTLCGQLIRRYQLEKVKDIQVFHTMDEIGNFLMTQFFGETQEKLRILCLNNRGELLNCSVVSVGTSTSTAVNTRAIVETVLRYATTAVVMAHNHPAGFAIPSADDFDSTVLVRKALDTVNVKLADHLVIGNGDYVSMRQSPQFVSAFSSYTRDESLPDWLDWR